MSKLVAQDDWVWIVVQYTPEGEQMVGQQLAGEEESFIPAFLKKEEAENNYKKLALTEGTHYEVQAMEYKELVRVTSASGFLIYILDEEGRILEKNRP